jgi:non-ribosomal peptide synthetase component F
VISPEKALKAGEVLVKRGVLRLERPDTAVKSAMKLLQWGMTPAAAFQVSAERFPDEPAIIDEKGSLTFEEVHRRTNALANAFR